MSGRPSFLVLAFSVALASARADGLDWKRISAPEGGDIRGLTASGDTVTAVLDQGDYYRSADGGRTWTLIYRSLGPAARKSMQWEPEPLTLGDRVLGQALTGGLLIFKGGRLERDLSGERDPFPFGWLHDFRRLGDQIFATDGTVLASRDSGATWTPRTDMPDGRGPVTDLADDGTDLYALNGGSDLFASADQGRTWSLVRGDMSRNSGLGGLVGLPGSVLAWWQNGEILGLRRQGARLAQVSAVLPGRGPWTLGYLAGRLVATGSQGVSQSRDGGLTWTALADALPYPIQALAEVPGGGLVAGTRDGPYLWNPLTGRWAPSRKGLAGVELRQLEKQGNSLIAMDFNTVYRSPDGGATWTRLSAPGASLLTRMAALSDDLLVFDDAYRIFLFGTGDTVGKEIAGEFRRWPENLWRSGKHWIARSVNGVVHVSHDDRKTWDSVGIARWAAQRARMAARGGRIIMESEKTIRYSEDTGYSWRTAPFSEPGGAWLALSGDAWLAVGSRGLYRSEDLSAGWLPVAIGRPGMSLQHLIDIGKTLYAVADSGLYSSEDHGATWEEAVAGIPRAEFATLSVGTTALCAKAENGTWWSAGLDGMDPSRIRFRAAGSDPAWPRILRSQGPAGAVTLEFSLAAPARLRARPIAANGAQIAPTLRKEFGAGPHKWVMTGSEGVTFWSIATEGPVSPLTWPLLRESGREAKN